MILSDHQQLEDERDSYLNGEFDTYSDYLNYLISNGLVLFPVQVSEDQESSLSDCSEHQSPLDFNNCNLALAP